ncbi:MAG: hypothetical protein JW768_06375 [Chitinispirillaceae bacterium]|nr:hypothetical protein [Chitinispirillaceae bacterium]
MNNTMFFSLCLFLPLVALKDTTHDAFYRQLEQELRSDYLACTDDSSRLPVKALIRWKHRMDSIATLPGFAAVVKAYEQETGASAGKSRSCKIVMWKLAKDSGAAAADHVEQKQKKGREEAEEESLAVLKELKALADNPRFLGAIPFGASKRAFFWLAAHAGFGKFEDQGSYITCDFVPLCGKYWLGAFYFDRLGLCRFELEGAPRRSDSLDLFVRPEVEHLASCFEKKTGNRPHQTNRVNRDEIVERKLSIVHAWSHRDWSVALGLSRYDYRYYSKAVVTNRPLPRE